MKLANRRALPLWMSLAATVALAEPPKYQLTKRMPLSGDGSWDYVTLDARAHRLYIAHATQVLVIDEGSGKQVGAIPDTPGVHGVALVPELGRGYISNGRDDSVTVFDTKSLKPLGKVKAGTNPDAIMYEPVSRRVFVFNGRSHDATVIDPVKQEAVATLALDGKPEFAVADGTGRVFVNLEDKAQLAVIDARKPEVLARWPLAPCEEPTGLAIDTKNHRLFAGCSNELMAVVDADKGKVVTTLPIGEGVDATAFDPATHLAFSSNGDGTLTVVHQDAPDQYRVVQTVPTAPGARTLALDPASHRVYLVTAKLGPAPAPSAENPHPRPTIAPGSFELLQVEAK